MRLFAAGARTADSRLVAWDALLVHVVDLLGIEELAGVAQVHLVSNEDVEEVGVDVAVFLHAPEDRERIGKRLAGLVWAIPGGERLEDVGDPHHASLDAHLLTRE